MSLNFYTDDSVGGGAEKTLETLLRAFKDAGHCVVGLETNAGGCIQAADPSYPGLAVLAFRPSRIYKRIEEQRQPYK